MKHCHCCQTDKPANKYYFYANKSRKDGLGTQCKECYKNYRRQYEKENREKINAQSARWRKNNIERARQIGRDYEKRNKEKRILKDREYKEKNRLVLLEKGRAYWRNNREKRLTYSREWSKNNPIKIREYSQKYRAIKTKAAVEDVSYDFILKRDGYVCHICGGKVKPDDVHFDHIIPLTRGGEHSHNNIAVAHSLCNISKSNSTLEEYYQRSDAVSVI